MSSHVRAFTLMLFTTALGACSCPGPVVNTCDPAKCAGCCKNGVCGSCGTGGGAATGGGTATGGGGDVGGGSASGGGTGGGTVTGGGSGGGGGTVTGGGTGGGTVTGGGTGGGTATGGGTGGGTVTGGGSGGGTPTGGGSGLVDFDGGWLIPLFPRNPALIGDGGTTVIGSGAANFTGPTTGPAISVVYPPSGVMLPPNTNSMEFHFIPGAGQTLFRFTFQAPTTTLVVYTTCTPLNGGCIYTPDPTFWSSLAAYARGTAPVSWTVSGVSSTLGSAIGTSPVQAMSFSEEDLRGGLYYWNSAGTVMRYDYGFPNAPRQQYLSRTDVGALTCVGCHVISRQGNSIAVGKDIPGPAAYTTLNVQTKTVINSSTGPLTGSANFFSFSPDEQHLLTSNGSSIQWRRLGNGASTNVTSPGAMPDWSPDGLHMVYAKPAMAPPFGFAALGVQSASLQTMHFNGSGFDPPVSLVPFNGANNYYPSYSPDGQWVLFNRSPRNSESSSNATVDPNDGGLPDGQLWVVPSSGGAAIKLDQASNPGACSWPKWAPVKHHYAGGRVMWLTFSSGRPYGLRLTANQNTQLWMVAFDPARAAGSMDPSFPAFWLPFQDISSGNHIGQWSTEVPRNDCTGTGQSTCAAGEVCGLGGKCRPG